MDIMETLKQIVNKLKQFGGVELSFGNPQTLNDLTIIPVAKVAYGFGGGSGSSSKKKKKAKTHHIDDTSEEMIETALEEKPKPDDFGIGGGGGMKTSPIGIFVLKKDKVRFYPVLSVTDIVIVSTIFIFLLRRLFRKK